MAPQPPANRGTISVRSPSRNPCPKRRLPDDRSHGSDLRLLHLLDGFDIRLPAYANLAPMGSNQSQPQGLGRSESVDSAVGNPENPIGDPQIIGHMRDENTAGRTSLSSVR